MRKITQDKKIIELLREYNNKFGSKLIKENHSENHIKSLFKKNYNEDEIVKEPKQIGTDKKDGDTWLMLDVDNAKELFDEGFKLYLLYDCRKPFYYNDPFRISNFDLALAELEYDKNMRIGIYLDQFIKEIFRKLSKYDDVYNRLYDLVDGGELELAMTLAKSQELLPIIENRDIQVINLLREYNSKYDLLNEDKDKKEEERINTLVKKLGLNPETAKVFNEVGKKLAIQLANTLLKSSFKYLRSVSEKEVTDSEILVVAKREMSKVVPNWAREKLTSIMDYVRAPKSIGGLENNIESIKNENFSEIYRLSQDWHKNLNIGDDKMDYEEKHPIILDFRNQNGIGYYWVDLETYDSPEECERMGHCGRSSKGRLLSLRSYRLYPGTDIKLNKSHLTAAIGDDGIMYQLKGPKNSKPKEEYHPYILPLFDMMDEGDEYFITGFGKEYASQQDFKLEDLPLETLKTIYSKRPDIFKGNRKFKEKMAELGIDVEMEDLPTAFQIDIEPLYVTYYIDGDEVAWDSTGYGGSKKKMLSEVVLSNDFDGMTGYIDIHHDFSPGTTTHRQSELYRIENILNNYVYNGLKSQMKRMIIDDIVNVQGASEEDKIKYENKPLSELLIDTEMGETILYYLHDIQRQLLVDKSFVLFKESLKNTLNKYVEDYYNGHIIFGKYYITIIGDLAELVDVGDPKVLEIYDKVEDDYDEIYVDDVFQRLIQEYIIPKPYWNKPDLNTIELDSDRFNEMLNENLNELEDR